MNNLNHRGITNAHLGRAEIIDGRSNNGGDFDKTRKISVLY